MKYIGAHVSAEGGVQNAPVNANNIGAKAFALFTKNQRQWFSSPLTAKAINEFRNNLTINRFRYCRTTATLSTWGIRRMSLSKSHEARFSTRCRDVNYWVSTGSIFIPEVT
jgi:hypothetical protein